MGFAINTVVVSGNLTRDPELRALPSGTSVCSFGIAYNERYKDNNSGEWTDRPNFFDCDLWAGQAEWFAQNVAKGTGVVVQGRLRWRSWEQDGQKRSAVSITVDHVFVPKTGGGGGARTQRQSEQAMYQGDVPVSPDDFAPVPVGGGGGAADQDDDIPF